MAMTNIEIAFVVLNFIVVVANSIERRIASRVELIVVAESSDAMAKIVGVAHSSQIKLELTSH